MSEVWKPVYDERYRKNYEVSNMGNVRSLKKNGKHIILKPYLENRGYLRVTLYPRVKTENKNEGRKHFRIHRLVLITFGGKENGDLEVNHINGDKTDNRLENLEWVTSSENQQHAVKLGLQKKR